MAKLREITEVHNLTAVTDSWCGTFAHGALADRARDSWRDTWPLNRYVTVTAEWHRSDDSGRRFIAVRCEGMDEPAEYAGRKSGAIRDQLSEAIQYTLDNIVKRKG